MSIKEEAILLRKQGKTFAEIGRELNIAKSTASAWLKDIKMTPRQTNAFSSI
ncbi:MAG: helix-turn-helix domain-containing protein [Candidatus Saccharimonadales bacterium]